MIDNGATVLTMPELVRDALAAVGADFDTTTPPLRLHRLSPAYHARFADGSSIDVHSDPDRMVAEVTRVCGADEARRYLELRRWLGRVFDAEFDTFIDANFDSPLDLFATRASATDLARLIAAGGFGRLGNQVARRIRAYAGSSRSRPSTPGWRRRKLSPSTARSRTWTPRWASPFPRAGCTPSPKR